MNLEDQLRSHFETKGEGLEVPMVELHLIPHPERSTPRHWVALASVALVAVTLLGFSQFSDTVRDTQPAPIDTPLPELASITQTVPTDLALPVELEWTKVLDQGGLQLISLDGAIHGIPNGFVEGADSIWSTTDGVSWTSSASDIDVSLLIGSDSQAVGLTWDERTRVLTMKTSTDGTTWHDVPTPFFDAHAIDGAGFDRDRFVVALLADPYSQNVMDALPEPYRSDPYINAYRDGNAVRVRVDLGWIGLPLQSFSAEELGLEPINHDERPDREWIWTSDFEKWEPLELDVSDEASLTPTGSSALVLHDWAQNRLQKVVDGELEAIGLDFVLEQLAGREGHWIGIGIDESGNTIRLSEDLRTWTSLQFPPSSHIDAMGSGEMGVVTVGFNRTFHNEPPEPATLHAEAEVEIVLDRNAGKIEVTQSGEWLYEVQLFGNSPSRYVSYGDGILVFHNRDGAPLAAVDVSTIEVPTSPEGRAVPAIVSFSTGDTAWSTFELPPVSIGPWRNPVLVTDEFVLLSFGDSVWMGTLKE